MIWFDIIIPIILLYFNLCIKSTLNNNCWTGYYYYCYCYVILLIFQSWPMLLDWKIWLSKVQAYLNNNFNRLSFSTMWHTFSAKGNLWCQSIGQVVVHWLGYQPQCTLCYMRIHSFHGVLRSKELYLVHHSWV